MINATTSTPQNCCCSMNQSLTMRIRRQNQSAKLLLVLGAVSLQVAGPLMNLVIFQTCRHLTHQKLRLQNFRIQLDATASEKDLTSEENPWREDAEGMLVKTAAEADAAWVTLQIEVDAAKDASKTLTLSEVRAAQLQHELRAAAILCEHSLNKLRPYIVPAMYLDIPPLRGAEDALVSLLSKPDAELVQNFLSKDQPLSEAGRAFWQAELYLRQLDVQPGESQVEEAAKEAGKQIQSEPEELQRALKDSVLLARQNYVSAGRFGYFLRRSRQRLTLESQIFGSDGRDRDLSKWLAKIRPGEAVELARVASREANEALEYRATSLFGNEIKLLRQLDFGTSAVEQLQLTSDGRRELSLEAAAFGIALFEAEEAAARRYDLQYTAQGSRAQSPLG
eukprot:TRINITY_DN41731_c0_g1_i1.p1 TRINITY_DN41731_c0_g1~~TRINITY_DN41731_c0_g1_i1.p1  ORF type:complete len:394 (+),score=70.10 TRINITY_DN41731_c0_g1_i1:1-1182(+)